MKYYKIEVKTNHKAKPSFFIGSTIRGAFGHALKEVSCINPSYKCKGCFAKEECLYYAFYEVHSGYRPFRFEVTLASRSYDFSLYLFFEEGRDEDIHTVLDALKLMLNKYGLTKKHIKFPKSTFRVERIFPLSPFESRDMTLPLQIKLLTPTIMKYANSSVKKNLSLDDILTSVYKKRAFYEEGKAHSKLSYTPSYSLVSQTHYSVKTTRRSDRQKRKITVEGYMGEYIVEGLDKKSYALLKYAEIVGIGNKSVMGHGRILIEHFFKN